MISYAAPDLAQHPPRSPRVRLGGFVHLPRLLDKARAAAADRLGEYVFPCPLDKRFFAFTGIAPEALLAAVKSGKSDTEMLAWVQTQLPAACTPWTIAAWSRWLETLTPGDARRHSSFSETLAELAPGREDISTMFDRLDLDDYASFGGRP